jgi:hypothetical protein
MTTEDRHDEKAPTDSLVFLCDDGKYGAVLGHGGPLDKALELMRKPWMDTKSIPVIIAWIAFAPDSSVIAAEGDIGKMERPDWVFQLPRPNRQARRSSTMHRIRHDQAVH